jgi:hypothetical protein
MREGVRPSTRVPARQTRCAARFEEGSRPPKDGANLHLGRSGPRGALLRRRAARLVSSCCPREGAVGRKGSGRPVTSRRSTRKRWGSRSVPLHRRVAEVGRAPSAQRSVRSVPRGSKAPAVHEARERGLSHKQPRARKRKGLFLVKGRRFVGARRSTSRERRATNEGVVGSLASRCERVARRSYRPKASRTGEAHAFHEAPAEPVLAASEPMRRSRSRVCAYEPGGGDRDAKGRRSGARGGRKRRRVARQRLPKWEPRRESRLSPASFASGGPELPGVSLRALRDARGGARKKTLYRVNEHEP